MNVTPGTNPTSTGIVVTGDFSSVGGTSAQQFLGSGNTFTSQVTVATSTAPGPKSLPVSIADGQGRSGGTAISLTVEQPPPPVDHIVISQVYGGGGNSGATYTNDYVELYNPASTTFDLAGWTLQYASAAGSGWGSGRQPLGGTIAPGEYYLVSLASGGAVGQPLPAANISGEINMSGTTGKIALVKSGVALSGICPLSDTNLVDFVGYGTGANCHEGAANAPAPGNTNAIFRKNNGALDANQNGTDFAAAAAAPRRTAAIVEIGPAVISSDPISGGSNAPLDDSITINFTEPVDVVGAWYNVQCARTGLHNDATFAGSGKSRVITPNVNFEPGEQCTVTVNKDAVHDQDQDDSAPNTDTLAADYSFTFTVATGAPPPYPKSVHLTMGNPSGATFDITQPNNYLMEKDSYTLSYNRDKGTPNWVSWHLETPWTGNLTRLDTFRPDPAVPSDWYRVQATDYFASGFDRGHMTPNADRDYENSIPLNQATFLMSNMVPQAPGNNQGPWAAMENYLRTLLTTNEIYIVAGPAGVGGTGSGGGVTTSIADGHVTVPSQTWKVALVIPKGNDDVARVNAATRTIAVIMPNQDSIRSNDWTQYIVSVDQVEQLTRYDFFSNVPDAVENSIEAGVNGANPPGTEGQSVTTAEDTPATFTLTAVSPNSNVNFTYTVTQPAHGALSGTGAQRTYTPAQNFTGSDSFTFSVNDGARNSNTSTITITVTDVNDAPVASDDSKSTQEDTPLSFLAGELLINDSAGAADEAAQTLSVASVSGGADTHGTVSFADGQITYTPAANYHGAASFTYQVCDDGTTAGSPDPRCATGTVNVTISSVNDAPTALDDSATTNEDMPVNISVLGNDTDADNDGLTVTAFTQGTHGSVTNNDAVLTYAPAANYHGADAFTYTVSDGDGGSATANVTVTINSVNDAPVASGTSATTDEDNQVAIPLAASDVEGDALTFSTANAPAHGSLSIDGNVATYTPAHDYHGADSFTFKANDSQLDSNAASVSIQINPVNDAPVAVADSATTDEDVPVTVDVLANDTDIDGEALSIQSVSGVTHGTAAIAAGTVVFTPEANYNGTASFSYVVADPNGTTASSTVSVMVSPVNDSPTARDDSAATDEDASVVLDVRANDADVDGDALAITAAGGASRGMVEITEDGKLRYTPNPNANGADRFTYTISDGHGGAATASVIVTINPINDAPEARADQARTDEDVPVTVDVLANDSDVDGDTLTLASVGDATHGTVTFTDGKAAFTPAANYNGAASFSYVVSDGHGGTATGGVSVTINPVNDAPTVESQSAKTNEDTAKTITLTGSDLDGDSLIYSIVAPPTHGAANVSGASVTYTPDADYHGSDSFTYKAHDGTLDSGEATVSLTINPVNDAPGANAQSVATDEDAPKSITLTGTDVETPASSLTFNITTQPSHGHLFGSAPNLSYAPDANYNGADSFEYTVTDAGDGSSAAITSAPATASITVNPVNDAPTLSGVPVSAPINELAAYGFTATAGDIDTPAQALTFSLVGAPAGASINPLTGVFSWTPTEAQGGTGVPYSLKVKVSDGVADATSDIVISVAEVNQNPTLDHVGSKSVNLGGSLSFTAVGHDDDLPAQSLSYSLTGAPAGAFIDAATGAFSWTPTAAQAGNIYTFGVRVTDGGSPALYAEEQITVGVAYTWSGVLPPVDANGGSVFRSGSTVPVKFRLTGASAGITNATVRLRLFQLLGGVTGAELPINSNSSAGNLFRNDGGQYHFNWDTSGLPAGSYQLRVDMGDGVARAVNVTIR